MGKQRAVFNRKRTGLRMFHSKRNQHLRWEIRSTKKSKMPETMPRHRCPRSSLPFNVFGPSRTTVPVVALPKPVSRCCTRFLYRVCASPFSDCRRTPEGVTPCRGVQAHHGVLRKRSSVSTPCSWDRHPGLHV